MHVRNRTLLENEPSDKYGLTQRSRDTEVKGAVKAGLFCGTA